MRIVIIGKQGQLATALCRAAPQSCVELAFLGRPELDLLDVRNVSRKVAAAQPDLVINAAGYTAVDKAETDESTAHIVNAHSAGAVAEGAAAVGAPIIHISTDYVFDGSKTIPYKECDQTGPLGAYGRTKLAGEAAVSAANPRRIIARTAWLYSPYGRNFVTMMLRLGLERDEMRIIADQIGSPTSADDLATGLLQIAPCVVSATPSKDIFGVTHICGAGIASWYDLARHIFRAAAECGVRAPLLHPIAAIDYPIPAARPANSRLNTNRLESIFGVAMPEWTKSVTRDVALLLADTASD